MISRIKGRIAGLSEELATIEIGGLFYELMIPSGLYDELKAAYEGGREVTLFTLSYIEAGDRSSYHYPRMVGFTKLIDKEFFQQFTTVSGLGFKKGLKSLILPIREIAAAIENKDAATLTRLPGIGRRLAEKTIAELNGKMARFALSRADEPLVSARKKKYDIAADAVEVLVQLQYKKPQAEDKVERALKANPEVRTVEELISIIFSQESVRGESIKS